MSKLIGFNGMMGVGKSEAIQEIKDRSKLPVELVKFAGPLYDMQEMIYRRIQSVYNRPADFKKDRKLLQWLGTEWGRETISKTIWVDLWKAEVTAALARGSVVVCDDVRFDNEAELVRSLGGIVVQITSSRASERIDTQSGIKNHSSEAGISAEFIDDILRNDGTLREFQNQVANLFYQFLLDPKSAV